MVKKTTDDRPRRRSVTLHDVAQHAQVSVATASRVLAGDYPVAAATRNKVLQAVDELRYVAASKRSRRNDTPRMVALVAPNVKSALVAHIAAGAEEAATESGRLCLICTTHGDVAREAEVVKQLSDQGSVDAVVLVGGTVESPEYRDRMRSYTEQLALTDARLVLCGRPPAGQDVPALVVEYDNIGGAYAATSYLLSAGHRRIVLLAGPEGYSSSEQRIDGYRRALADYGLEFDPALIRSIAATRSGGYAGTEKLLQDDLDFSAIFAINDSAATGVMAALGQAGIRVPDDVSLVGYDNLPMAQELSPPLTTVHLPHEELGRAAVRLAVESPDQGSGREHVTLATHVVVRDSVRPVQS